MGIETERAQEAKKHELKYVPTEWKAEQMDKKLVRKDVGGWRKGRHGVGC